MKTSDLTGLPLCYVVCMIEMPHLKWGDTIGIHHASYQIVVPELPEPDCYSPFMNWKMFGPIIDREGISWHCGNKSSWHAYAYGSAENFTGPTALVAAMRCYVASELGNEVDVPEELL